MGPVRRGLIAGLALIPSAAWAEVCDKVRPDWDGIPEDGLGEAIALFSTVPSLVLLVATALVIRFRSSWGALAVCVLWTAFVSFISFPFADKGTVMPLARAEGCVGSPTLFIGIVAAICVAMILYTAPRNTRTDKPES